MSPQRINKHVLEGSAAIETEEETTSDLDNGAVRAPVSSGSSLPVNGRNGGTPIDYSGRTTLKREQCDIYSQTKEL
jgi:hypothetical protein